MRWLIVLVLVAGCASEEDCEAPIGFYVETITEIAGGCGLVGSQEFEITPRNWYGTFSNSDCRGTRRLSPDLCSVELDISCVFPDASSFELVGLMEQDGDSTRLVGMQTYRLSAPDGSFQCQSDYIARWNQL